MRIKLIALIVSIVGTFSWAIFHQISKKETLPEKIKLYAFYTSAHKDFIEQSLAKTIDHDYELELKEVTQEHATLEQQVDTMLHIIKENWGGIFVVATIHADYRQPSKEFILQSLEQSDLLLDRNEHKNIIGSGFLACRANKKTLQLWEMVKYMIDEQPDIANQDYLQQVLNKNKIARLRWDYVSLSLEQQNPVA